MGWRPNEEREDNVLLHKHVSLGLLCWCRPEGRGWCFILEMAGVQWSWWLLAYGLTGWSRNNWAMSSLDFSRDSQLNPKALYVDLDESRGHWEELTKLSGCSQGCSSSTWLGSLTPSNLMEKRGEKKEKRGKDICLTLQIHDFQL